VTRLYTIRPCSSVSSIGSSSYISGSSLPLKSPTLKDHDIHSVIYERFSRSKGYGDLPLQFVAVFVAEDDIHPGRYNIVGTFGVGDLNVRPVPGSTSFHRLTWDLMIYECPPPRSLKVGLFSVHNEMKDEPVCVSRFLTSATRLSDCCQRGELRAPGPIILTLEFANESAVMWKEMRGGVSRCIPGRRAGTAGGAEGHDDDRDADRGRAIDSAPAGQRAGADRSRRPQTPLPRPLPRVGPNVSQTPERAGARAGAARRIAQTGGCRARAGPLCAPSGWGSRPGRSPSSRRRGTGRRRRCADRCRLQNRDSMPHRGRADRVGGDLGVPLGTRTVCYAYICFRVYFGDIRSRRTDAAKGSLRTWSSDVEDSAYRSAPPELRNEESYDG
jgi:hypothetical protein